MYEEQIKKALKDAGLKEELWTKLKIEKEDDIPAAVTDLKKSIDAQAEVDRRVTEALKTREANLRKEFEREKEQLKAELLKENKESPNENSNNGENDTMKQLQAMLSDALKPFQDKITQLETRTVEEQRKAKVISALKEKGLNEKFMPFITVQSDDEIETTVNSFVENIQAVQQTKIDEALANAGSPKGGRLNSETSNQLINDIVKQANDKSAVSGTGIPGKSMEPLITGKGVKDGS